MIVSSFRSRNKITSILVIFVLVSSFYILIPTLNIQSEVIESIPDKFSIDQINDLLGNNDMNSFASEDYNQGSFYPSDINLGDLLVDNPNEYVQTYQPWLSKAAVRCIAVTEDYEVMAVGGGYLYGNEVHIYKLNHRTNQYDRVWDCGDGIILDDIIAMEIGDTDHNDFLELIVASADGHFHVFEQKHIYDPITNTESMFVHVFSSPYIGQVWGLELKDIDKDFVPDIIVGSWDRKIHVYEYTIHSGYPFAPEHWITYEEKWVSHTLDYHPTSIVAGDTNFNGLPDFVVGTREGGIFVFENNGTVLDIQGYPYPLTQDDSYKLIYTNTDSIWRPIYSMDIADLDNNPGEEVAIAVFAYDAYVMSYDIAREEYYLQKLNKGYESWETKGPFKADYYVDSALEGQNVFLNDNLSNPEPDYYPEVEPFNSGISQNSLTTWTTFAPEVDQSAWEVFDFGVDEEGTGNGHFKPDLSVVFKDSITEEDLGNFTFEISINSQHWMRINSTDISLGISEEGKDAVKINVDPYLAISKQNYFRYIRVTVKENEESYNIHLIRLYYVNRIVSTALCTKIGTLSPDTTNGGELNVLIGTVDGRILAFRYDVSEEVFVLNWESYQDDRFTLGTNIWDLEQVQTAGVMPIIYGLTTDSDELDSYIHLGQGIIDYDFGDIDLADPYDIEFVISDKSGDFQIYSYEHYLDPSEKALFSYDDTATNDFLGLINADTNYDGEHLSVSVIEINSALIGPEIVVGLLQEDISSFLHVWGRTGTSYEYVGYLSDYDPIGQLDYIISSWKSYHPPSIDGCDIDLDGDTDIIMCTDRAYLLLNIGDTSNPIFVLEPDYFNDIEEVRNTRHLFSPQFIDFDQDGDFDLISGYGDRIGATYFENKGSSEEPIWVEKKELLNNFDEKASINDYNLTRPLFVPYREYSPSLTDYLTYQTGQNHSLRYMACYMLDLNNNNTIEFEIDYATQTSFMVATNPVVSRFDLNTFKSATLASDSTKIWRNFGFRAIESWTTLDELSEWILTLDTADIDQDGVGEIIVGDFDHNVYIFEHLTNNTYKRIFRSPNMIQFFETDESPYAHEELGGISAIFNKTIMNHVSYLLVDLDIDLDNYKEFAVLAGNVLYVFENTGVDDTFELMYRLDILETTSGEYLVENNYLKPTGLAWGDDLDKNGYGEIILAFEKQLLIFEPYNGKLYETFGLTSETFGHFNLPGNSMIYDNLTISGILSTDSNRNGLEEIIIYGNIGKIGWYETGFVAIIESNIHGYQIIWEAPFSVVVNNDISMIEIADQDYDGFSEIVICGKKGISIWEFNGTETYTSYQEISIITGDMNYPVMNANSILGKNIETNRWKLYHVTHDCIQLTYNNEHISFLAVWQENSEIDSSVTLYQAESYDGKNWHSIRELPNYFPPAPYIHNIAKYPALVQIPSKSDQVPGVVYIVWIQFLDAMESEHYAICMMNSTDLGETWNSPIILEEFWDTSVPYESPYRTIALTNCGDEGFGYVFVFNGNSENSIRYGRYFTNGTIINAREINDLNGFLAESIDIASKPDSSKTIAVTMRAFYKNESKSDGDIWFFQTNYDFTNISEPQRVVSNFIEDVSPSIAYLKKPPFPLLISYDSYNYEKGITETFNVLTSNYVDWTEPKTLAAFPSYFLQEAVSIEYSKPVIEDYESFQITDLGFRGAKILSLQNGGYAVISKLDATIDNGISTYYIDDLLFQINNQNKTNFGIIGETTEIAFGDTDGDGLSEILVADGYRAKLFEIYSTGVDYHLYQIKYISPLFEKSVSDVSIYDTNGNGFAELIISVQGDDVYIYEVSNLTLPIVSLNKTSFEVPIYNILEYDIEKLYSDIGVISPETVFLADFLEEGIPQLFFITDDNVASIFSFQTQSLIRHQLDFPHTNIVEAFPACYDTDLNPQAFYFVTEDRVIGLISVENWQLEWYKTYLNYFAEIKDVVVYPIYNTSDYILIGGEHDGGWGSLHIWDIDGNFHYEVDVFEYAQGIDKISVGPYARNNIIIACFSDIGIEFYGIDYDWWFIPGNYDLISEGYRDPAYMYEYLILKQDNSIRMYDAQNRTWVSDWEILLESDDKLLNLKVVDIDSDNSTEFIINQYGLSLSVFNNNGSMIWKHIHNSFVDSYIELYFDNYFGQTILCTDNSKMYVYHPNYEIILAITDFYSEIIFLETVQLDDSMSLMLVTEDSIHGFELQTDIVLSYKITFEELYPIQNILRTLFPFTSSILFLSLGILVIKTQKRKVKIK